MIIAGWYKWAADAEAALRTTVDTARLAGGTPFHTILGSLTAGQSGERYFR